MIPLYPVTYNEKCGMIPYISLLSFRKEFAG